MATDRTEVLRNAEKLLRTGKLELAIEEYVRLVGEQPSDWNTRHALGDLYLRANRPDLAVAQYGEIATHLVREGHGPKAAPLYRKILKIRPDDQLARLQLAELGEPDMAPAGFGAPPVSLERPGAEEPAARLARVERELRDGRVDAAGPLLADLIRDDAAMQAQVVHLGWALAPTAPHAAYACIEAAVNGELASGNHMDAAALLQEFTTRVSGQIAALLKLVEICVDGRLEATMYETQAQLADTYLELGQGVEARVIAEDLVAREPWEPAHIDRFRRALLLLNVRDPDAVIAERLSGKGPFIATDPFPDPPVREPEPPSQPEPAPERDPAPPTPPVREPAPAPPPRRDPEPDIPLRPKTAGPVSAVPQPKGSDSLDIDLTDVLSQLHGMTKPAAPAAPPAVHEDHEVVFDPRRNQESRQADVQEATEQLALARTYVEMGMTDEAMTALARAVKPPTLRFEAASLLGRLHLQKEDPENAIEWFERAAEAPAPSPDEGHELLYDLGATLELTGDVSRALAVFMELQADADDYRDVAARVDRLSRMQTGD